MTIAPPPLLSGAAFKADPYPTYAQLREAQPLFCRTSRDGAARMWFLTRHEEVAAALRDDRRFVKDAGATLTDAERRTRPPAPPLYQLLTHHMLNADGDAHARLRGLVNKAFSARQVEQLAPRLHTIAHDLLDPLVARGAMDYVNDFALPFSIAVIAELLGIPSRDHHRFRAWSHILVAPSTDAARNARKTARLQQVMTDFVGYLQGICAERRRTPRADLITTLLEAEESGDRLSTEELFSMILLLTIVGHETSVYLLANQTLTFLTRPSVLAAVHADSTLMPAAIEEAIRFDGPVERATMRFAAADIELHDQKIQRGDAVSLVLAAAHRDPRAYPRADEYDLTRGARHLGFGLGAHYCLGAPLARLEAHLALDALRERLPGIHLTTAPTHLRWQTNPIVRGPKRLPLAWQAR